MSKRIYVGNLPFTVTEQDVKNLFAQYGTVEMVTLATDRQTGQARGFGFVEMDEGADEAISGLDEKEFGGRNLRVNEAKPRDSGSRN